MHGTANIFYHVILRVLSLLVILCTIIIISKHIIDCGSINHFPLVPCPLICAPGYELNATACTCILSNICHLSPCQNGGSCTLVSAPSNYTCDCTGTGYQGVNCDCKYCEWE